MLSHLPLPAPHLTYSLQAPVIVAYLPFPGLWAGEGLRHGLAVKAEPSCWDLIPHILAL